MAEVILNKKQIETLVVDIEGKKYSIPLGGSLPYSKLKTLKSEEAFMEFFSEHITEKVFDTLTIDEIRQISDAWSNATKASQGITLGE